MLDLLGVGGCELVGHIGNSRIEVGRHGRYRVVEFANLALEFAQVGAEALEGVTDMNMAAKQPAKVSTKSGH